MYLLKLLNLKIFSVLYFPHSQANLVQNKEIESNKAFDLQEVLFTASYNAQFIMQKPIYVGLLRFLNWVLFNYKACFAQMNIDKMSRQQADNARWSALMASAQMGSKSDYQQLLTELANVIHAYLRKHLGSQDFLEDCVQDTLLAIHQARHTYDPKRSFRPWLFTIVRHKLIDHLRHKTANQRVIQQHQEAIRQQGEQPNVVEASIDNNSLLNTLSVLNREVLTRTKLLGFTCAETAKQLGISESAVKVRVHRAINKLRQILEDED